jgi:prophage antirepressor-like protein
MDTLTIYFDENKNRYFIAREIATVLEYKNTSDFLRKISDWGKNSQTKPKNNTSYRKWS